MSLDDNPRTHPDPDRHNPVEAGMAGDYSISIGHILGEAWQRTGGAKWIIHLAMFIYFGISILAGIGIAIIAMVLPESGMTEMFYQLLMMAVTTPLWAGLWMIGLRRAVGAPVRASQILDYFHLTLPLLGLYLLMTVFTVLGFLLLILPGIYLAIAYLLAIPLMVDKGLAPWEAMEASRKAISKRWFTVFGLTLAISFLNLLAMIPFGLGLIWTLPMTNIAFGILYRNIFGCSDKSMTATF
ncbi:hypothetical protein [Endozoicomonas ascidiicola]|uniref:hypothetical protein n=1 Tax=Endozoicomonas ascidiicola TaxID=1698521 RepID=UPI0008364E89|nr:hypothetical protein [Endozoicomonas ascidiicola]